jgi:excisionase family DNA binding protein
MESVEMQKLLAKPALTPGEVVRMLPLSRSSVYEAIARQEIPSIRVGRKFLVPTAWLRTAFSL